MEQNYDLHLRSPAVCFEATVRLKLLEVIGKFLICRLGGYMKDSFISRTYLFPDRVIAKR